MNSNSTEDVGYGSSSSRTKKIACRACRKRKARCDGGRPACMFCLQTGESCHYAPDRKRSGPKVGYMKEIVTRLSRLEEGRLASPPLTQPSKATLESSNILVHDEKATQKSTQKMPPNEWHRSDRTDEVVFDPIIERSEERTINEPPTARSLSHKSLSGQDSLPTEGFIRELEQSYFDKSNVLFPIIHRIRYNEGLQMAEAPNPPLYLRFAIWSLGALNLGKYRSEAESFYLRCRSILEDTEVRDTQQRFWDVPCVQTWILVATYEFKMMYFARAWMSSGRGSHLASMLTFNKIDQNDSNFKQGLPLTTDPVELEERRRALWAAYHVDKFAGMGTSYTSIFNEEDLQTHLPCSEQGWHSGMVEETCTLSDGLVGIDVHLSAFSLLVLCAAVWSKYMAHVYRARNEDVFSLDGPWWMRHYELDRYLRLLEMRIFSYQYSPPPTPAMDLANCTLQASRCFEAACEICRISSMTTMTSILRVDVNYQYCVYVAADFLLGLVKREPENKDAAARYEFLLEALNVTEDAVPTARSYLLQLELESQGVQFSTSFPFSVKKAQNEKAVPEFTNYGGRPWG